MTDNKRRHTRIHIAGSVRLAFDDGDGNVIVEGMISNISLSSIALYVNRQIKEKTDVAVNIHFISSGGVVRNTAMKGHIVYSMGLENLFFTVIEFTDEIDPDKNTDLYNHIQQSLTWQ